MCVWRNNTRNIPIYSDFVAQIWSMYTITLYLNFFCFQKFVWNITRPRSSVKFYDNRMKYNKLDILLTTILPILWAPLMVITQSARYRIIEDLGPTFEAGMSLDSVLIRCVPILLITGAAGWFTVLTMINIWGACHIGPPKRVIKLGQLQFDRTFPRKKAIKYIALSIFNLKSLVFGCIWVFVPVIVDLKREHPWYTKSDVRGNIQQLPLILTRTRDQIDPIVNTHFRAFFFSFPVLAIVLFISFGLGPEALKTYHLWLQKLLSLLKLPTVFNFLQTHALRLVGWFNQRVVPVDPEYFIPFRSNDIILDPFPLVDLPTTSRRSLIQPLPTQPRIKPLLHPAPLRDIKQRTLTANLPLEQWRTYRKQPITAELHQTHQSPGFPQFRPSPKGRQAPMASGRWIDHHKEPTPSLSALRMPILVPPGQSHVNVGSPPVATRLDNQRLPSATIPIGRPPRYDGLPQSERPPVDRGSTSDPLSALFF
ncbi:hypothetical protein FRC16_000488 [Serendipita sp. 398]|nr:hypothetical protein FRC16_000488 [Serendipita sp. 398]